MPQLWMDVKVKMARKTLTLRYLAKNGLERLETQDQRLETLDLRPKTQDVKFKTPGLVSQV